MSFLIISVALVINMGFFVALNLFSFCWCYVVEVWPNVSLSTKPTWPIMLWLLWWHVSRTNVTAPTCHSLYFLLDFKQIYSSSIFRHPNRPIATMSVSENPIYSPFFGVMGAASAMIFSAMGAAYGTAKSGTGIAAMAVMRPGQCILY